MKTGMQRERLLEAGLKLIHERGYASVGVREIAKAAGVPEGSFTNHFRSKEVFGRLVLDRYFSELETVMSETLERADLNPRERLEAYVDRIGGELAAGGWRKGCLVVDLCAEVPPRSEVFRQRLCEVVARQSAGFAAALRTAASDAPDRPDVETIEDRAGFLLAAWQGSLLRMKAEQDPDAIARFKKMLPRFL